MNKKENILKFTIIIPTYNSENYIEKAIESVLNQTYSNLELIIVNDGSTDSTPEIINRYAKQDKRIKIFSKENGGYVSAIRKGIENSSGDYTIFLGSDDYLDLNLLKELSSAPVENPDLFIFNTFQFNSDISKFDIYSNITKFKFIDDISFYENIKDIDNGQGLLCNRDTSKAFKTANLKENYYFGRFGVDADDAFTMSYARKFHKFCFLPITGYYNFLRKDSVSARKPSIDVKIDVIKVWINFFKQINHGSKLNYFEKEFLFDSLPTINEIKYNFSLLLKNYRLIKEYKRSCFFWIKSFRKTRFMDALSFGLPITYFFANRIYRIFKRK